MEKILPYIPADTDDTAEKEIDLIKEITRPQPAAHKHSEHLLTGAVLPSEVASSISEKDLIRLKLLMTSWVGTGSQRGSITRILNTLRDRIPDPESPKLRRILHNAPYYE